MTTDDRGGCGSRATRRRVLESLGGTGAVALAGCLGSDGATTETSTDDSVTIGLSSPESGRYSPIGDHERRGFELAVTHLNEGGGLVGGEGFANLSGDGVLDRTVETAIADTEGDASTAETNLQQRLGDDELAMFTGGVAGSVVTTHRDLADEHETPYFVGTSTLNQLTGENCSPHVYRELFNSRTLARALVPEVVADIDGAQFFFQVSSDTIEGRDLKQSINGYATASDLDLRPIGSTTVRSGSTDFERPLSEAASNSVDIVFLDLFGLDAVNAIQQAKEILPEDAVIVVPLLTQSVADSLGERVEGVYGTVGWHENLGTPLSGKFGDAYQNEYSGTVSTTALVPPGPAQNAYGQVLLWASAAEAAGTFDADAVRSELEGFEYALGAGAETMRACDHQAMRAVPVVRGSTETDSVGNYFELLNGRRNMEPGCDEPPASACEL
ncbi:ABC transporter substrate-binding protein [Halomicrobium mukohataei]|uniref:ABC transporter substrate-binding protein n=1 Tax=Halomicrobium mukohataei TaxID=57705 RepID=A0A847UF09_9EURY|nr:substrate-binding protein [Halomicrobium mukohataei]NLV10024.1 ABC transporter substrate-binding protein [Halomicrobium mukohataei]